MLQQKQPRKGRRARRGKHPLVVETAQKIVKDKSGKYYLPPECSARIESSLKAMSGRIELRDAVESLMDLAAHMDHKLKAPEVAAGLVALARAAVPALRRLGRERSGAMVKTTPADRLQRFSGVAKVTLTAPPPPKGKVATPPSPGDSFNSRSVHRGKIR